ncbi:MAG: hypothetical protein GYB35_07430 [Algicola sp.]|nr:hypothetical protein [Algicola sp.]
MNDFFIFQYIDNINLKKTESITVVFVNQRKYPRHKNLIDELESYFQSHLLTDKLIIILPAYSSSEIKDYFNKDIYETFRRVPGFNEKYYEESCSVYQFGVKGEYSLCNGKDIERFLKSSLIDFFKYLERHGATKIFRNRGGLVESSPDHHFVFPSKKHSEKFIRTGNVLINSAEIFFIAIQLLERFDKASSIYCDTSSINVLPFAIFEIKRRFGEDFDSIPINSFESYNVFEKKNSSFKRDSLVIISSSTSGNIIDRLIKKRLAKRDQIIVLFFLGKKKKFLQHEENIVCDLTKDLNNFKNGFDIFETYPDYDNCKLCKKFSRPIEINSDVFLTVQPKVKNVTLKKIDAPKYLSPFMHRHRAKKEKDNIFKTYYRDTVDNLGNYEVYIDSSRLLELLKSKNASKKFKEKLERKINTYIPANSKYIIFLNDEGSEILANFIKDNVSFKLNPELISIDDIQKVKNQNGSAIVVGSSIVTGRHYLHLSRVLRDYNKLSIIYFINIFRTSSSDYGRTTKSNLSQGKDGGQTYPIVSVEDVTCSPRKGNTNWDYEKNFLEELISEIDEDLNQELASFVKNRLEILRNNRVTKGLVNNVFLNKFNGERLSLRKGFVFWDFDVKEATAYQSQVYFTISTVLNNIYNNPIDSERTLKQSNYIRNLLSPDNFQRFNDGIIQASILRAGKLEFFAYDLSKESSLKMKTLLKSMVDNYDNEHGEALPEFLLAIGTRKLRLKKKDLKSFLNYCSRIENQLLKQYSAYLVKVIL